MHVVFAVSLLIVAIVLAFVRGGEPERVGAGILFWTFGGEAALHQIFAYQYRAVDPISATVDAVAMVGFTWLSLATATRSWPLWASAAQLVAVLGHLMRWIDPNSIPQAYGIMFRAPSYLQSVALIIGSLNNARRRTLHGKERFWRTSLRR